MTPEVSLGDVHEVRDLKTNQLDPKCHNYVIPNS